MKKWKTPSQQHNHHTRTEFSPANGPHQKEQQDPPPPHHRYCECNYSAGINFDAYFGTYRDTLKETATTATTTNKNSPTNSDGSNEKAEHEPSPKLPPPPVDPKSSLGFPEHSEYQLGTYALVFGSLYAYHKGIIITSPSVVAVVVSFGPAIWALILSVRTAPKSMSWRKVCLAPFDKDSTASLVLHLGLGLVLAVFPITHLLNLVLD